MGKLARRYTHVPLGVLSLLLVLGTIAWMLERRVDGVWEPAPAPIPVPPAVGRVDAEASKPTVLAAAPSAPSPESEGRAARAAAGSPDLAGERYALESGPFLSAQVANRHEEQLNRLGYATIRFRKHEPARVYVVTATGFSSPEEARRVAAELGEGAPPETNGLTEVVLHRLPSLHEAVAASRPLRERGLQVRVSEDVSPTIIFHIRFGQFPSEAAAHARQEELLRMGLDTRVVKVR